MQFLLIIIVLTYVEVLYCQWQNNLALLTSNTLFTQQTGPYASQQSGTFLQFNTQITAYFITCTNPKTSYITLNSQYPSVETDQNYFLQSGYFVAFDLFFKSTWDIQVIRFKFGSFEYQYIYYEPSDHPLTYKFCDNKIVDVKTVNFSITTTNYEKIQFIFSYFNIGWVSIRNFYISSFNCYPSCSSCSGSGFNECTDCYFQTPTNGICPSCPTNQYYAKHIGCKPICDIGSSLIKKGFCQNYPTQSFISTQFTPNVSSPENMKWSLILDPLHVDNTLLPNIYVNYQYIYGIFKYHSGVNRFINELSSNYSTYLIGFKITLITFNDIPLGCGIQININNTYYGSISRNDQGIQAHQLSIYETSDFGSYPTYSSVKKYVLVTYYDIPKNPLLFSAVGNFSDNSAGWGIMQVQATSGYCPQFCKLCEVPFKCKTCNSGYYYYKDGTCISSCSLPYQKIVDSYCQDYDDETPYSMFLVQEYINTANDPEQYSQYTLISKNGINFLKGLDIYYSYWQSYRVFGGPFVWAQAKFKRVHNILDPHHSLTIAFYILYGPTFPSNGYFIYTIENKSPVYKSSSNAQSDYSDGSKYDKVYERISHNTNTLTIYWECYGLNNEPIEAYCGFYNYYIAVHKCKPYCLQCSDQNTCTQWNSTYDQNIVKFSQAECDIHEYYDKEQVRCIQCPIPCLYCRSKLDCLSCQPTYTLSKLGCTCKQNQYEQSNQCYDCPIECNQCLSQTYCIECLISNNRQLQNGQCICIDGYYPIISNPQCLLCHQLCQTCTGPTSNECLTCKNILNIEQIGTTCKCSIGLYYKDSTQTCSNCHSSCQSCFSSAINGCLTCNLSLQRILKGLKCECKPGYYEVNDICINCPNTEDNSLTQCYKLCNNNQQIWHTTICSSCDGGFQLQYGECQPICGDSQIKGYEQCEHNNNVVDDLCYNCQYQCPAHCLTCDQSTNLPCPDICGDGYITGIEECEDGNAIQYDGCYHCKFQCQPSCTKCIKGECQECGTVGWFIDPAVTPQQCKERCGDSLIVGIEQCDDANTSDADGCKDCKYFCRIGCSSCDYSTGSCLSCEFPGFAPYYYFCTNICGDGLVVTDPYGYYYEQCDDANTSNYDGCSSWCQFQCQPSYICTNCVNNRCETCAQYYQLSENKICIPICGDQQQLFDENCEDSFILPYKGCQNCIPKCQSSCIDCDNNGKGCLACQFGYERIDNLCFSICGDQIVTDDEQCDDGNFKLADGCHFCQFSCQDSCGNCISGLCYNCLDGYQLIQNKCHPICEDAILRNDEQCEIIDQSISEGCVNCQFKCDVNCQICLFGMCQLCQVGFHMPPDGQSCQRDYQQQDIQLEYCKLQIGNACKQCEDFAQLNQITKTCSVNLQYKKCMKNCKLCLDQICLECYTGYYGFKCIPQLGDGIVVEEEICFDQNNYDTIECYSKCDVNCISCIIGICDLCLQGFYLFNNKCIPNIITNILYVNDDLDLCGDYKLSINEECEDGNTYPFDGCYQCKFQCDVNCINCQFGKCESCNSGYILNNNYMCEPECGDGIVIPFTSEQCDEEDEGCLNCQFYCQPYCLQCNVHQCFQCFNGFSINQNECIPVCGDGILLSDFEECDDQNDEQFDGCFECRFQCQQNCEICEEGNCLREFCYDGTYWLKDQCQAICGDKIIAGDEQCDDGNQIQYDGCHNCQFQCNQQCNICEEGICLECIIDYALIDALCVLNQKKLINNTNPGSFNNNSSINSNGNSNNNKNNTINSNGVKQQESVLESNEICRDSECAYSKKPNMKLTYNYQQFSYQYVDISFDQEIKFSDSVIKQQELFNISILDLEPKDYNITVNTIQEVSFDLQNAFYQVVVEIFPQLVNRPILFISLNQEVINSNNQTLQENNQTITLYIPKVISESIKSTSIKAQQSNKAFMIGAICLCVISLISGESSVFVETLNVLQYQSYLRFINIEYPENLFIYFQAQDLLSITSYLQFFQLDDYLDFITRKEQQYVDLKGKFKEYNIEADLFTNIFPQMIQFLGLITLLRFTKKIHNLLFKLLQYKKVIYYIQTTKSKILMAIINFILYLGKSVKQLIRIRYLFNCDQIRQLIYLNSWDLIFKVILQLNYNRIDNIRSILTTVFAALIFLYYFYFLLQSFKQCSDIYNKNTKAKLEIKFITLDMCRTIFFHIVLILFQDQQFLQCLLLSVSSLCQCCLLYKYKRCSKWDKITSILIEAILTVFSLSLFFYIEIEQVYISYENKVTLGFIHMNLLILSLAIVLAKQLIPKIINICKFLFQQKKPKVATEILFF
ncbi:unnamed protein product (macronuclear) [Paramecium tetraurelia]|uniref:EGF-like domain-containing protein n=1 Tax=Paramecium tetraurelia TaxID=5888 RepID=A0CEF0_PARTE|nr:uncharacterized protein GSPATT00037604001 [Paramecium tetraurelia]CAK69167.1 unnamed protein product [Paramecium tetraurelia]|eukprot:XP_001436564.1 hypothetical protein (macronuclear) [Paramecium tetraurelia strain d4-2]